MNRFNHSRLEVGVDLLQFTCNNGKSILYTMSVLKQLKAKGYRITSQRKYILSELSHTPITAEELFTRLQKRNIAADIVSVYRTLELFTGMNLVEEIDLGDGKKRYELYTDGNHHHHLVCNTCGKIENVNLAGEKLLLNEIALQTHFQVKRHSLEFFGFCKKCRYI